MKGLVFREFLEMVEAQQGYDVVDSMIEKSGVKSKGIYTSVGTYDAAEMFALVGELSKITGVEIEELLKSFGKYVFNVFRKGYPDFFKGKKNTFDLLADVEGTIHVEVLKLYPDAELPTFEVKKHTKTQMELVYRSVRKMSAFAEGLIEQSLEYYKEKAVVNKELLNSDGSEVLFTINKTND